MRSNLFSHKLLRYAVPIFLFLLFIASAILSFASVFFTFVFALQIGFYLSAILGLILEKFGKIGGIMAMPLYFVLANLASLVGFFKFLRGEKFASWETNREKREEKISTFEHTV